MDIESDIGGCPLKMRGLQLGQGAYARWHRSLGATDVKTDVLHSRII